MSEMLAPFEGLPTPLVVTASKVRLMGVRPAGPSMKTAAAVAPPEVVMVPEVAVMACVLFCAASPRSPVSGDMSRSAEAMAAGLLDRATESPGHGVGGAVG